MILSIDTVGKIKPYVRMTQKSKYCDPQATEYLASKKHLQWRFKCEMAAQGEDMLPEKTPLEIDIFVGVPSKQGHGADVDNILKAILDAMQGIVFKDDRWIDKVNIERDFGHTDLYIVIKAIKETEDEDDSK